MAYLVFGLATILAASQHVAIAQQNQFGFEIPAIVINSHDNCDLGGSYPSKEELDTALNKITSYISAVVQEIIISSQLPQCGGGLWYRIAHVNMSDPSQQCPSAWREVTMHGIKVCARPNSTDSEGSCPGVLYHASGQYSKICGRVIGYQFGSPSAFERGVIEDRTIDEAYVEGVSITHGRNPRKHIWSYAAGASEINRRDSCSQINCPCNGGYESPNFVGNNYYCESAHKDYCWVINRFFPNDHLWDGQQCDNDEGTCCTGANTPPWFSVDLSDSTSDDIEVRICHDQDTTDEDTPIQLLELYVQ